MFVLSTDFQLWTFETTPIPGVFYIVSNLSTGYVVTAPADGSFGNPTIQPKLDGNHPTQMWKILQYMNAQCQIQNYFLQSNGPVFVVGANATGEPVTLYSISTGDNDNQKFFVQVK